MSRLTENSVKTSLLFFRTSPASRTTPRFLGESRILPPLSAMMCIEALLSVARAEPPGSLEIHFAPEEGDPYAVQLAGKVKGYVTGLDSDFVILNTDGYMGYIPLEDFLWHSSLDAASETTSQATEEGDNNDDDFQPVQRRKKAKKKQSITDKSIIPPQGLVGSLEGLALSCSVYTPSALADHLDIPVSLLPLLGALVGNDFSPSYHNSQSLFFAHNVTLSQRITRVSTVLRTVLTGSAGPRRKQKPITSVMDLIRRTVLALFIRDVSHMPSGKQEAIIEKIVDSTLQYAIPKKEEHLSDLRGPLCLLHAVHLPASTSSHPDNATVIRELYNAAYQRADLSPKVLDVLHSGSYWPRLFLENPDVECTAKSISRPIREWFYAILDDGVGLPEKAELESSESPQPDEEDEEEDEDELIDVVEEESEDEELFDPLAPLRGALERLEGDLSTTPPPVVPSPAVRKPRFVDEYIRRGTRVAPEEVCVPSLSTLLSHLPAPFATPVQLLPEETRFRLLVSILSSEPAFAQIIALPQEQVIPVLAIRSVLWVLYERSMLSPNSKERLKEKWTKRELNALLLTFVSPPNSLEPSDEQAPPPPPPEILDRHVQLTAQLFAALESVIVLAQVLLLGRQRLPYTLISRFSGKRFHALLNLGVTGVNGSSNGLVDKGVPSGLWTSVTVGFDDDVFSEDRGKKIKRASRDVRRKDQKQTASVAKGRFNGGMFGLLANVEA
jgi:hypothetical protein